MTPQVHLHVSNQLDLLALELAKVTARPVGSPFTPETVIVQSVAARRWLSLRLADARRICANYSFPFLGGFINDLITGALANSNSTNNPSQPRASATRPELDVLTWRIDSALRRCHAQPEFAALARYLEDENPLRRFALAARIANLFDQYRVYRPERLLAWSSERGLDAPESSRTGDEAWQAKLWLEVDGSADFDRAFHRLRTRGFFPAQAEQLPARLSVFAPTTLPSAYLDLLFHLSRVSEVHVFILRASEHFHGDDLTPKARARLGPTDSSADTAERASEDDDVASQGNPLLTSWGRADAELTNLLADTEERLGIPLHTASENLSAPVPVNLLTNLQHQIFSAAPGAGCEVQPGDRSLLLHACHTPMREVEVLYDHLLDCFQRYPHLRPRDVLVMTPEIEKYAPLIRAVFSYPENESIRIPYAIADRHPRSDSVPIDTFLTLLDLADTRYTAPEVFLLLSSRPLRQRFGLYDEDLSLIHEWIDATGIRWGIDAAHRGSQGVPAEAANTWRQGLDRLLLGFAMEGHNRDLFAGILPHDEVEGDGAATLGRFITAVEALFRLAEDLTEPRPLADWVAPLQHLISQFLEPANGNDADDVRFLRTVIERLRTLGAETPAADPVDFPALRLFLAEEVGALEQHGSFLSGSVTFCALKPVRSIPAQVICLLGVNDQVFPRHPRQVQFDLMAQHRRPGDPSPGNDDRFAFLETVLSARQSLSISYIGRSVQDNQRLPPSVVISELTDYLNGAFLFPDAKTAEQFLLVEHPLHAFSPKYFRAAAAPEADPGLFSFSTANASASQHIQAGYQAAARPFVRSPLPAKARTDLTIDLAALLYFWANPCKSFLRRRLGMDLPEMEETLLADEPYELDNLEQYWLRQELLNSSLHLAPEASTAAYAARGNLPPGMIGEMQLRSFRAEAAKFARTIETHLSSRVKDPVRDIKLTLEPFTLRGRLGTLYDGRPVHFRCALLKGKDKLRAWIEHLVFCASNPAEVKSTLLLGLDAVIRFRPVPEAGNYLADLCAIFLEGENRPPPFFPTTSLAYVQAEIKGKGNPLRAARTQWESPKEAHGDNSDRFVACCFNGLDPLDTHFVEMARRICGPLLEHAETVVDQPR